jgi:hypothetical protein
MSAQRDDVSDQLEERPRARRIELPPLEPITPEELERRRILVEEILALREEIGPIGINVVDLIDDSGYDDVSNNPA